MTVEELRDFMAGPQASILSGVPVNLPPNWPPYTPGTDRFQVPCECCSEPMWIGSKMEAAKAKYPRMPMVCAKCVFAAGTVIKDNIKALDEIASN